MNRNSTFYLIGLFVFPILLFGFALGLISLPLPDLFPPAGSQERNLLAAILTGMIGMVWLGILVYQVIRMVTNPGRMLDPIFESKGLKSRRYLGIGREYEGYLEDRLVIIRFIPGRVLQNTLFTIRMQADHSRNLLITNGTPIGLDNRFSRVTNLEGLEGISVFAEDHSFANSLLTVPNSSASIKDGFSVQKVGRIEIRLQPGWVIFRARPNSRLHETDINTWLKALLELSSVIEKTN